MPSNFQMASHGSNWVRAYESNRITLQLKEPLAQCPLSARPVDALLKIFLLLISG